MAGAWGGAWGGACFCVPESDSGRSVVSPVATQLEPHVRIRIASDILSIFIHDIRIRRRNGLSADTAQFVCHRARWFVGIGTLGTTLETGLETTLPGRPAVLQSRLVDHVAGAI